MPVLAQYSCCDHSVKDVNKPNVRRHFAIVGELESGGFYDRGMEIPAMQNIELQVVTYISGA